MTLNECPLYPQERTSGSAELSAKGQKRTLGLPFNHFFGTSEKGPDQQKSPMSYCKMQN
jgi:hypothetical protein